MVKDVSASCAKKALLARRITRWGAAALMACSGVATAAELPASLSLQQASAGLDQTSAVASSLRSFEIGLPAAATTDLLQIENELSEQTLNFPVGDSLELNVAMGGAKEPSSFAQEYAGTTGIWRPVESLSFKAGIGLIHQNPIVGPDGIVNLATPASICAAGSSAYLNCLAARASGNQESAQTYMIGARWKAFGRVSVGLDYTSSNLESKPSELGASTLLSNTALIDQIGQTGTTLSSRTQALDFSLSCDIGAGHWGDLELGLQVSRIMTEGALAEFVPGNSLTDPFTQASLGLGWQLGDFRSDFTSRYLDVLDGQGNNQTPWTSLDVNFSWRTPWNASLSVGARNVFNNPAPENNGLSDPNIDDLFGRVPYVRYRQDL